MEGSVPVKEKSNRGLSAVYGGSSELAAQDEQEADDLVTGEVFGAGTAAAVVVTAAADGVAALSEPSANYPDYYHGLSRQQRRYWRKITATSDVYAFCLTQVKLEVCHRKCHGH